MYLVSTLRDWFGQDYDDHLGIIERKKIQAQIALLFKNIADTIQDVAGSQWDFFLNCIYEWIMVIIFFFAICNMYLFIYIYNIE